jgi:ABC-type cobalamin/Fe3+-siderophores transport system ATPase subunit
MLQAEDIRVSFGTRQVLNGISLELIPGQILGVIGPNGGGKTTLVRALSGILPLKGGHVWVDGQDLNRLSPAQRARKVAVVPQAVQLPPAFSAWETVLLGRTPYLNWLGQVCARDEAIVRQAMQRTHTLELAERLVGELSGGEQQRLLLARALAQAAPILMLDEPTAHLDLQYQIGLLEEVRSLARQDKLAVLMVVHDLNLAARYADRVALLVSGQLDAVGSPQEVLTPTRLSTVYHVPLQVLPVGQRGYPVIMPVGK